MRLIVATIVLGITQSAIGASIPPPPLNDSQICSGKIVLRAEVVHVYPRKGATPCSFSKATKCTSVQYDIKPLAVLKSDESDRRRVSVVSRISVEKIFEWPESTRKSILSDVGREFIIYGSKENWDANGDLPLVKFVPVDWYSDEEIDKFSAKCPKN